MKSFFFGFGAEMKCWKINIFGEIGFKMKIPKSSRIHQIQLNSIGFWMDLAKGNQPKFK